MAVLIWFIVLGLILLAVFVAGVSIGWDCAEESLTTDAGIESEQAALEATQRLSATAWVARQQLFEVARAEQRSLDVPRVAGNRRDQ